MYPISVEIKRSTSAHLHIAELLYKVANVANINKAGYRNQKNMFLLHLIFFFNDYFFY